MRTPVFHHFGCVTFKTPQGVVGVSLNWLADRITLCYPLAVAELTAQEITDHLEVFPAQPISRVDAINFAEVPESFDGDLEGPFEQHGHKFWVGYKAQSELVTWGSYYSKRLSPFGRVWLDHVPFPQNQFSTIGPGPELIRHDELRYFATHWTETCNKYAVDGAIVNTAAIAPLHHKFIALALHKAATMGGIKSVTVEYTGITPEDLVESGHSLLWLRGEAETKTGHGQELILAQGSPEEEILIESGNSIIPWVTYRKLSWPESYNFKDQIAKIFTF